MKDKEKGKEEESIVFTNLWCLNVPVKCLGGSIDKSPTIPGHVIMLEFGRT